jgi:hypothetical protein
MDKNTKKKQEINAILEKYNLKRTKTNAVPDNNFQITPKSDSQIIHVSKSLPNSPSNTTTASPTIKTVSTTRPNSTPPSTVSNNISSNISNNTVKNEPDVKALLDKDKKEIIKQKINMPQAIISKSNTKNTPKNFNLYDIIPIKKESSSNGNNDTNNIDNLAKPSKQAIQSQQQDAIKKLMQQKIMQKQNELQQQEKQPVKVIPKEAPIKVVSIDPTLSLDKSQDYKGTSGNAPTSIPTSAPTIDIEQSRRTPSPIRHVLTEQLARKQQANKPTITAEKPLKTITIDQNDSVLSGGSKKQNLSRSKDNSETLEISPELLELAKQRKALQEQQMLELKKFKEKKAQIINLNNRKKEIELMKSIEAEKQKLLKIQAKQHELNNIYNNQLQQSHREQQHSSSQVHFTQPHQNTIKQIPYFELKKTKKNMSENNNKPSKPSKSIEVKDFIPESKKDQIQVKTIEKEDTARKDKPTEPEPENIPEKDKDIKPEKDIEVKAKKEVKEKKELKIGEPLEYYKKKDWEKITWPTKKEIYDETKFTEHINTMTISFVKLFKNPKTSKDKATDKDIQKFLKNNYKFEHLDEFKPTLLKLLYKLLNYENIEIDIISH